MVSTLRPDESNVETEMSLRAAAAVVGVVSMPTEHRITEFEPNENGNSMIFSDDVLLSSAVPEIKRGTFLFTTHVVLIEETPIVEKPCTFPKTTDATCAFEKPRNSKLKVVRLFLRY